METRREAPAEVGRLHHQRHKNFTRETARQRDKKLTRSRCLAPSLWIFPSPSQHRPWFDWRFAPNNARRSVCALSALVRIGKLSVRAERRKESRRPL